MKDKNKDLLEDVKDRVKKDLEEDPELNEILSQQVVQIHRSQPSIEIKRNENGKISYTITSVSDSIDDAVEIAIEKYKQLEEYFYPIKSGKNN